MYQLLTGHYMYGLDDLPRSSPKIDGPRLPSWSESLPPLRFLPSRLPMSLLTPPSFSFLTLSPAVCARAVELVVICTPRTRMLEYRLRSFAHVAEHMSEDDVRTTCAFISRCIEMDPTKRATAAELLEDEWFRT